MRLQITRTNDSYEYMRIKNAVERLGHTSVMVGNIDSRSEGEQRKIRYTSLMESSGLVVVEGWQSCDEAKREVALANELGIPVFRISESGSLEPRVKVVGISGYARTGKDTIGAALIEDGYVRASFADYIRDALYRLNPWTAGGKTVVELVDELGWEGIKPDYPEIREMLQRLGSEVGRSLLGEDVWVNLTFSNLPDGAKVVVTDCRFPNEAAAIKKLNGEMWRVERVGFSPANAHISETALDDWTFDKTFYNDGTISVLHNEVRSYLYQAQS